MTLRKVINVCFVSQTEAADLKKKSVQGCNQNNVGLAFLVYSVSPVAELSHKSSLLSVACDLAGRGEKMWENGRRVCELYPSLSNEICEIFMSRLTPLCERTVYMGIL